MSRLLTTLLLLAQLVVGLSFGVRGRAARWGSSVCGTNPGFDAAEFERALKSAGPLPPSPTPTADKAAAGPILDQMRAEQQILLRMAESQRDIAPLIRSVGELANTMSGTGMPAQSGMDEASRGHLRNIDASLTRLVSALAANRDDTVREIRNEIKLLAKTIASTAHREPPQDSSF